MTIRARKQLREFGQVNDVTERQLRRWGFKPSRFYGDMFWTRHGRYWFYTRNQELLPMGARKNVDAYFVCLNG